MGTKLLLRKVINWWLAGNVDPANCVAAYQPKYPAGASTTNLANPGTYNARPLIPPSWDAINGWKFVAGAHSYLDTGVSVNGGNYSVIVAIAGATSGAGTYPRITGVSLASNADPKLQIGFQETADRYYVNGAAGKTAGDVVTSGVFAVAGSKAYYNGVDEEVDLGTWSGTNNNTLYIGDSNSGGAPRGGYFLGNIQAYAIYNTVLTAAQILAIKNAIGNIPAVDNTPGTYSILDFGAVGDGIVDCTAPFNRAITFINACGGGTIYVPTGTYKIAENSITWKSNVSMYGDGIGNSIIKLYASYCIRHAGALNNVLLNCDFTDIEVDGSEQTFNATATKGFYLVYCNDVNFTRVKVLNTVATGFGNDMLVDCSYTDCIAVGCGRGRQITDPGSSGFGVGTGAYAVENSTFTNCTATGNKRYGIFFEKQFDVGVGYLSTGMVVNGGTYNENQWGVGDCGVDGLVVNGATINSNLDHGVIVDGPSLYSVAGINGTIENCEIANNTNIGISPVAPDTYTLTNNNIHDNGEGA